MNQPQLRECMGCGLFQIVPELEPDTRCDCVRCGTTLRRSRRDPLNRGLALNFAALGLFIIVWTAMLMKVSTAGIVHETWLHSGPMELVRQGLWPLALAVAFTTGLAPAAKFLGTIYVLVGLRLPRPLPYLRGVFRFTRKINIWSMLEVLLLGVFVAYTKLGALVQMDIGAAVYALGLLTLVVVWADIVLVPDAVWEAIERTGQTHAPMPAERPLAFRPGAVGCESCGLVSVPEEHEHHCPRCGAALHARKPDSLNRTWAFVIAGAILYIPANYYPVLTVIQAGSGAPSTIIGGVEELLVLADVPARPAGVLRQHPGAGLQADRPRHHADGHHAGDHRVGRPRLAAPADTSLLHRCLDRALVDGRYLHGVVAGRARPVRRPRHHCAGRRRGCLLRRRAAHHRRRRMLRSAG